jgi:predicted nucleic acid-binding protein
MKSYALDTNILIYAFDDTEPVKQARAVELLNALRRRVLVVPAQTFAEAAYVLTFRRKPPYTPTRVAQVLQDLREVCTPALLTPEVVFEALRGVERYKMAYYDAQIWAAARLSGADVLLSEDFQSGRTVEGVTFVNPFDPAFSVATL